MNKKSFLVALILFLVFGFNITAKADGAYIVEKTSSSDPNLEEVMEGYSAGGVYKTISSSGETVTVYGKSICSPTTNQCSYTYSTQGTDVDDYFSTYISCSGGEKKVGYKDSEAVTGAASPFKGTYSGAEELTEKFNVYWSEEYKLYCIDEDVNDDDYSHTVNLGNSTGSSGGSSSGGSSSGGSSSGDFPSSSTVENEDTGVFTYYIVLIVIALCSYGLLLLSKKYNFFKKI